MSTTLRLRTDDLEWRDVEGEVVALDLRTSTYLAVNRSGAKLWGELVVGATREQLVEKLVAEFAIPREQAESETDTFVEMLAGRDMLLEG